MKISSEILEKYANNSCTPAERELVLEWLENLTDETDDVIVPDIDNRQKNSWETINKKTKSKLQISNQWLAAASVALLLLGYTLFQTFFNREYIYYETIAGETKMVILTDGTKVYLNANSQLKIPKEPAKDIRIVYLEGEGFFEVAKDSLHPFIIKTDKTITKVLGTKFNLYAYKKEDNIITLNEGKVSFGILDDSDKIPLILLPNEQGILRGNTLKKKTVNPDHYNGWITNKLYFNSESFATIAHKIERVYNVKIHIQDNTLKQQTYRGMYSKTSLEELLEDLSFVLQFDYIIKEKSVTIY